MYYFFTILYLNVILTSNFEKKSGSLAKQNLFKKLYLFKTYKLFIKLFFL